MLPEHLTDDLENKSRRQLISVIDYLTEYININKEQYKALLKEIQFCATEEMYDYDYDDNYVACGTVSVCPICRGEYDHDEDCKLFKLMEDK
jgi:hypothetical protein